MFIPEIKRCDDYDEYLRVKEALETHCATNVATARRDRLRTHVLEARDKAKSLACLETKIERELRDFIRATIKHAAKVIGDLTARREKELLENTRADMESFFELTASYASDLILIVHEQYQGDRVAVEDEVNARVLVLNSEVQDHVLAATIEAFLAEQKTSHPSVPGLDTRIEFQIHGRTAQSPD